MPTYEYMCEQCGHALELFQKMSDPAETHCPQCGTDHLKRQISAVGFQLKGTGWYVTDFRDKKSKDTSTEKTDSTQESTATVPDTPSKEVTSSKAATPSSVSTQDSAN